MVVGRATVSVAGKRYIGSRWKIVLGFARLWNDDEKDVLGEVAEAVAIAVERVIWKKRMGVIRRIGRNRLITRWKR